MADKEYDPSKATPKDGIAPTQAERIAYNQWTKKRTAESENPTLPSIEDWVRIQKKGGKP